MCSYTPLLLLRLVVDEWLELKFPSSESGQQMFSAVQTLRSTWTHLLEMKLQRSQRWYQGINSSIQNNSIQ